MNNSVFSRIIRGEIPCTKVYEDDEFFAFLDINPVAKGHTLLIPKEPSRWIHETSDDVIAKIFVKAKELISAMRESIPCDYVQIVIDGEEVPYFHIHLIPSMLGHKQGHWDHVTYEEGEKENFAEGIQKNLK